MMNSILPYQLIILNLISCGVYIGTACKICFLILHIYSKLRVKKYTGVYLHRHTVNIAGGRVYCHGPTKYTLKVR